MKKIIIILFTIISLSLVADLKTELKELNEMKVDKNFIKSYEIAVKEFELNKKLPEKYMAEYLNIGLIYLRENKNDNAIELYDRIIKSKLDNVSTNYWAYYGISSAYFHKKDFKKAYENGKKAIEIDGEIFKLFNDKIFFDDSTKLRVEGLMKRTLTSGYVEEKYEEIIKIFLKSVKNEDYRDILLNNEIILKTMISSAFSISKTDKNLGGKYFKEFEKLGFLKIVREK